ncbi:Phage terminase, large subunit, PBSX family [Lysobacter dokdonensis DS-58]|uniref:Phage terminase, large subunit, PBSX family n=1 Tax=Lysobacter dokdonensis DS-58 TaxID=1300345 RepID=A0A0A2WJC0_9GAMM|nr:terminase family protein [Lysobacter dokdonensis]KGQ19918.1 Phage terminase, large subunit, PBSX family [Lysobacter dokdonensis DS-58]
MGVSPTLTKPQARFLALPHKFGAFVGGFGSGKTWTLCAGQAKHYWEHPKAHRGYFAPTYPQIRDIFFPTVEEVAHDWGLRVRIAEVNKEVHWYSGRQYRGTTICRSMEKPDSIVGFKIAEADVDEVDTLPALKAQQAWRKIIARLRLKYEGKNGARVATTPEGFKFTYDQWVKQVRDKPALAPLYGLVQASTYENERFLPDGYIDSLLASYPPQLIEAYLQGHFVNLTAGTVYHAFDRKQNACSDVMVDGEPVFVGMDFNVGKMAAVIHVKRDGQPRAVGEVVNAYDTPDMIRILKERLGERQIRVYPDASGGSRKSVNASVTDIKLLKEGGFQVSAPDANPPVKDRINSMNGMFCNAQNERRYRVNVDLCPTYADCLEQQVWAENGEPDKASGNDHPNDAAGYFIHRDFPIIKRIARVEPLRV